MAQRKSGRVQWKTGGAWSVSPAGSAQARRGVTGGPDPFIAQLAGEGRLTVEDERVAEATAGRRAAAPEALECTIEAAPGEAFLLAVRHPSGALTFHPPRDVKPGRRGGRASTTLRFSVVLPEGSAAPGRRGLLSRVVRAIVLKVVGKLVDLALPKLAELWETRHWKNSGKNTGWVRVTPEKLREGRLPLLKDFGALLPPPERNLLLIHGILSSAEGAFDDLATARGNDGHDFFSAVRHIYGDRIFAFNHFTVSRSPRQNAEALLDALPARSSLFDVVTHSRGGLVLRTLVERRQDLGIKAGRFQLGRAVLVAAPNEGTPLATVDNWERFVGWFANLLEILPDNPFTFGLEFLSEGLVWMAQRAIGPLPGVGAAAMDGAAIRELQGEPGPPRDAYSALVSNYEPDEKIFQRMLDAGVDAFFNMANDLVVPTEGGWRVDQDAEPFIPGGRIGCFGPGGNIALPGGGVVPHTGFFSRTETVDFLVNALTGQKQPFSPQDPAAVLPFRRGRRAMAAAAAAAAPRPVAVRAALPTPAAVPPAGPAPAPPALPAAAPQAPRPLDSTFGDVLHLFVMSSDAARSVAAGRSRARPDSNKARLVASYRNARVVQQFRERGGAAGRRWREIIAMQERIRGYIDGQSNVEMPNQEELTTFGKVLFHTLFPGDVKRLYDAARAEQTSRRLDIIFTSMISWVADKPWEFAYDPSRKTFLATEEVNFVRNVLTAVPAEKIGPRSEPLRILVAVAQPIGAGALSVEEEVQAIMRGFRPLVDAGLAEVEVIPRATADLLHKHIQSRQFDILHFIGHGERGYLLFEDAGGRRHELAVRSLREILCRRGIRLVFLNACETGTGGNADFNRGVAPALVSGGVPAVVANQYKVLDASATVYAQHFYWALAYGRTLGDAAREARIAVNYSITGEAIDWAVPVVYALNPTDRFRHEPLEFRPEPALRAEAQRRRRGERRCQIALWDVNHVIPSLERVADTMNSAQDVFHFEVVELHAPLGTWRFEKSEGGFYLDAPKVAQRLRHKPDELGVDRLFCITNFPVRDNKTFDLYGWDGDPAERISIFSTAGLLDQMQGPEFSRERAVANMVVSFLTGIDDHRTGVKTCPNYYNRDRYIRYIAAPLRLCAYCRRRKLKEPATLAVLDKILAAFP